MAKRPIWWPLLLVLCAGPPQPVAADQGSVVATATSPQPERAAAAEEGGGGAAAATLFLEAEKRILAGYDRALLKGDMSGLDGMEAALRHLAANSEQADYYRRYWLGLTLYLKSLALMRQGKRDDAKDVLADAIETLKGIAHPDEEVYALLGLAAGLNLQFVSRQSIMLAISEVNGYLARALSGRETLRGLYANAVSDWNTPVEYGGRLRAEDFVRKALSLPDRAGGPLSPSWGRDFATALLVRILLTKGKKAEALELLEQARKQLPDSAVLAELRISE
ncbi:MAG: hypothetical protein KatS3mg119_0459 [Rhodothalassiaceae bacterium]|nr:MAG: hypothetical protein KatS3mg119_0459 [Rhodothalassiaceae bacterium]